MRKKQRNLFKKKKRYLLVWVIVVVFLFLFSIFSTTVPWRGVFQDFSVAVGRLFVKDQVHLERYDRELIASLREENEELRKLLDFKTSLVDYEMIPSSVIYRSSAFEDTIIIDCGEKEGVSVNMAVVTEQGLIGKVEEVYSHSSLVRLLTDSIKSSKVAVSIFSNEEEFHGILDGYDPTSKTFSVTSIQNIETLEIGSRVVTNGLGSLFPSGIFVGTVSEVTTDTLGVSLVMKVQSSVDFYQLGYVFVLGK